MGQKAPVKSVLHHHIIRSLLSERDPICFYTCFAVECRRMVLEIPLLRNVVLYVVARVKRFTPVVAEVVRP